MSAARRAVWSDLAWLCPNDYPGLEGLGTLDALQLLGVRDGQVLVVQGAATPCGKHRDCSSRVRGPAGIGWFM